MAEFPGKKGGRRALTAALRRFDEHPLLVRAARAGRRRLPGDTQYGDPLSLSGEEAPQVIGRGLATITAERPSALRELGMSTLQVWQALSEAQGRGHGDRERAILFTDLAGFSNWSLGAGDTLTLELLRRLGASVEPLVEARRGRVVKRLGDGFMAVFDDPVDAVHAARDAVRAVDGLCEDEQLRLRAGVHVGRPRKLGNDFFGVDVNIAARVADAAKAGEVLVSDAVAARLADEEVELRRKHLFRAKGTPKDVKVYVIKRWPVARDPDDGNGEP